MNRRVFALLLAALLVTVPTAYSLRATSPVYTVEDLGTLDGLVPTITGMNAAGQLSGHVSGASGSRAVWFNNGVWNYLPGLNNTFSLATAINAQGDITGYRMVFVLVNNKNTAVLRPFRYVHGSAAVDGIAPLPGGTSATAFGIADNGAVVGSGNIIGVGTRAWIATGAAAELLPGLDGMTSKACGINANGQIAGSYTSPSAGTEHAFRFDADGQVNDLGTLDGSAGTSVACAIDSDGTVGGRSLTSSQTLAFLSAGGTPVNVTPVGASVAEVKGVVSGLAVGSFSLPATGEKHAFVYTSAESTTDLNDRLAPGSGWVLSDAVVVNPNGLIAGQGTLNGSPRAYRLTPPAATADTVAPTITQLSASPSSITPPNKAMVSVTVSAVATDDHDANPSCAVTSVDRHGAPADDAMFSGLSATVRATGGAAYTLTVTCSDAAGNHATAAVDVVVPPDTTAPVFTSLVASPNIIWPPKGQTVNVTTAATAADDSGDAPTCRLDQITGPGAAPDDFNVTGPNTGTVKAVGGRTYVFHEVCTDAVNNAASSEVSVTVPADTTAPVVTSVSATPSTISPPNGLFVAVTVAAVATDDVDDAPACALSSIDPSSAPEATGNDAAITGALAARVRAVGGRTYTLNLRCSDAAGNTSTVSSTTVVVPPDTTAPVIVSVTPTPARVWPPNGALVPVSVAVVATDDVDATPACVVSSISASGSTPGDYSLSGGLTATVRAVGGRTYALGVECSDAAGNHSAVTSTTVVVPADTTAPVITSLVASPNTIWPPKGQFVTVTTTAVATDDSGETPACTLSGVTATGASAADASVTGANTGRVKAVGGRVYTLTENCTDGSGNASSATVNVTVLADTTAPVIAGVVPSPSTIGPPNNLLVPVTLAVTVTDDVDDQPACAVSSISASGAAAGDATITGSLSARLRAVGGRTYRLNVLCTDAAGNSAAGFTEVVVPPDADAPVVTSMTASPGNLWPPNGKMVHVALSVHVTDNLDPTPQCTLTSVTSNGGGTGDVSVTGALSANLRAEKNGDGSLRVYTLNVTCVDDAANSSTWAADITVSKEAAIAASVGRFKLIRTALAHQDWRARLQRLATGWKASRR